MCRCGQEGCELSRVQQAVLLLRQRPRSGAASATGPGHIPGAIRGNVCVATAGGGGHGALFSGSLQEEECSSAVSPACEQDGRDVAGVG